VFHLVLTAFITLQTKAFYTLKKHVRKEEKAEHLLAYTGIKYLDSIQIKGGGSSNLGGGEALALL
jgi:hypothetical protein